VGSTRIDDFSDNKTSFGGFLGYKQLRAEARYNGATFGDDTSGVLYGVGLNYSFTPAISGRLEAQKPSSDSTNYGAGVVFKF
jgi:OOP family OmpA-OmpF porin